MPDHEHAYSTTPGEGYGYCECGDFDPNHGTDVEGATPHIDEDEDGFCDACDHTMPSHVHDYSNYGTCVCGATCPHETVTEGVCEGCKATISTTQVTTGNSFDNPTAWTTWYELPSGVSLKFGSELTISGTATSAMAQNYHYVTWEIKQGYTGRMDDFGWIFPELEKNPVVGKTRTSTIAIVNATGEAVAFDWAVVREIAKDSSWSINFRWTEDDVVVVTMTVTADSGTYAGYTYTNVVKLSVDDSNLTEITVHLTADTVANFTVTEYTQISYPTTGADETPEATVPGTEE